MRINAFIEIAIARGERLEGIMDSAQNLESKTLSFNKLSKEVKCTAIKDNVWQHRGNLGISQTLAHSAQNKLKLRFDLS